MVIKTTGPNAAIVVCGGRKRTAKRIINGSWGFVSPLTTKSNYIPLTLMTLNPICHDVLTLEGVPINVSAIAQCKIVNSLETVITAAEQFLGRTSQQIKWSILQTIEGHLRAILGTLTVEEIYKDREKFAVQVREVASTDVAKMGIGIISFVITDIEDRVDYLKSLGKKRTAEVKRDAAIGVAYANRAAGIREAECENEAYSVRYQTLTKIENYSRMYNLQKADFDKEVNTAKAEAALAYELEVARIKQQIRLEELGISIIERKKDIEIQQKEIECKERELTASIKLPAEAEKYRIETIASGQKSSVIENSKGIATKIKLTGVAQANKSRRVGILKALSMALKARALKDYGEVGIRSLVNEKLPEIAASISAPLKKTENILLLGNGSDSLISNINALAGQIPPAIKAINNINIEKFFEKFSPNE